MNHILNTRKSFCTVLLATCIIFFSLSSSAFSQNNDGTNTQTKIDLTKHEGVVIPSQQVQLIAPFPGILQEINVKEGDRVTQGEKLANMDDRIQIYTVSLAQQQAESDAAINRAQAALDEAQLVHDQTLQMVDRHAASQFEAQRAAVLLSQAKADLQLARENKAQMQTNLQLESQRLAQHRIEAPFTGQIIRISTEPGSSINDEDPILSMASLSPLEVNLYLPIALFGQLQQGQTYALHAQSPINKSLPATLIYIDPIIDSASETFRTVWTIQNPDYTLPAGFTVTLADIAPSSTSSADSSAAK
ncbi:efflux RND transporter periplasmic adaptor subunit [Poriferisphaera sp. WC338]|uniref:efflux RND transporter periplasmic adaptor subunit n=1 Tax=Poriferisphaera sp. WC338 TaxID=3425129 RepID=UPI003D8143DA